MRLLTESFAADITDQLLLQLGWRTVWLHAALTATPADLLAPRDREVLALVATSALGVDVDAVAHHLSRLGVGVAAAESCLTRLVSLGYLSQQRRHVDLSMEDLAWIAATARAGGPR